MTKLFTVLLFPLLFIATDNHAQKHEFDSNEPQTVHREIKRNDGQLYKLLITLPPDFNSDREYKILYYLDAWWLEGLVTGAYRVKSLSNKSLANNMDELILVGISHVGNERAWNKQRLMDFTPSKSSLNMVIHYGGEQLSAETTGGAENFINFFKYQIIESIERDYKIDPSSRCILGHSFGGLFGFYAYVNHPELFSNYILLAPAIWWNDSEVFKDRESILSKREVKMFIAMGTGEIKMIKIPMAALVQELKLEKNNKLEFTYKQYENEDHHSVLPKSIYDGIELLYTKSN